VKQIFDEPASILPDSWEEIDPEELEERAERERERRGEEALEHVGEVPERYEDDIAELGRREAYEDQDALRDGDQE
jgi:hypothetical protein